MLRRSEVEKLSAEQLLIVLSNAWLKVEVDVVTYPPTEHIQERHLFLVEARAHSSGKSFGVNKDRTLQRALQNLVMNMTLLSNVNVNKLIDEGVRKFLETTEDTESTEVEPTEHSPGPWIFCGNQIDNAHGVTILRSFLPFEQLNCYDVKLAASAPELLEACEACLLRDDIANDELGDILRDVVAKAKGKAR